MKHETLYLTKVVFPSHNLITIYA